MRTLQYRHGIIALAAACGLSGVIAGSALAQSPDQAEAYLIRQDFSDCQNSNVNANNPALIGGSILIVRASDGTLHLKVGVTGTPKTTYNIYLKCVRQLGTIETYDEGAGIAEFTIPAGQASNPLTFDMYPNGAPAGNKFQSTPVRF